MTALVHFIAGSTGAGKTTYALKLCEEIGGVRFSIDEWMAALYWMDSPQPLAPDWTMERLARCYAQIWNVTAQTARRGVPCVLDLGFSQRTAREEFAALASSAAFDVHLHVLNAPAEERWRRVEGRNAERGQTYQLQFDVTRDMFDFVELMWEPPGEAEMRAYDAVTLVGG